MSDHSVTIVRLDPTDGAEALADGVASWLLSTGVIRTHPGSGGAAANQFAAGEQYHLVVNDPQRLFHPSGTNDGVDVHRSPAVFDSGGNFEPPLCGGCERSIDADLYVDHIEAWVSDGEPDVTCDACGWHRPLGDWPGQWAFAVGAPAVEFHNWPELKASFLADLGDRLGPRTKTVYQHI